MEKTEVKIGGFGGQGVILTGYVIGKAASIFDTKNATMTQSFGPEARGSACSSQLIISDETILYPYVKTPRIMVIMSQEAFTKNVKALVPGGLLIWDTDLVQADDLDPSWTRYYVPATRFAEEMGNKTDNRPWR